MKDFNLKEYIQQIVDERLEAYEHKIGAKRMLLKDELKSCGPCGICMGEPVSLKNNESILWDDCDEELTGCLDKAVDVLDNKDKSSRPSLKPVKFKSDTQLRDALKSLREAYGYSIEKLSELTGYELDILKQSEDGGYYPTKGMLRVILSFYPGVDVYNVMGLSYDLVNNAATIALGLAQGNLDSSKTSKRSRVQIIMDNNKYKIKCLYLEKMSIDKISRQIGVGYTMMGKWIKENKEFLGMK